jgi:hypothetical protein
MNRSLDEIDLEEAEKDLNVVLEQYVRNSEQIRETIDEAQKVPLELIRARLNRQARKLEAQIADIRARLHPSPIEGKGEGELLSAPAALGPVKRWAVLVGINRYMDFGPLRVCASDVEAITDTLQQSGYENIRSLTDGAERKPTRNEILMAMETTAELTGANDLLLFYFSGHGDVENNKGYLIAQDTYHRNLEETGVALSKVKEMMKKAAANKKVIIIDACHAGADLDSKGDKRMTEDFIREVYEKARGWAALASCEQGQLSYQWGEKQRSVFTHFLLEALAGEADFHDKKIVSVHDTHLYVLDRVKAWAANNNKRQTPTLEAEVAGDIILVDLRK